MRSRSITALITVAASIGTTIAASGSSHLVGSSATEHCGNSNGLSISCRDDEAIQLRFDNANGQSALTIDFVLRGRDLPPGQRVVEIFLTSQQRLSGRVPSTVMLLMDHRPYPLATNVDSRGIVKSVLSFESFVDLAMTSLIQGTAFGERFVATDRQMLTLRLAAGRWAANATNGK